MSWDLRFSEKFLFEKNSKSWDFKMSNMVNLQQAYYTIPYTNMI